MVGKENEHKPAVEVLAEEIFLRQEAMIKELMESYYGKSLENGSDLKGRPVEEMLALFNFSSIGRFPAGRYEAGQKIINNDGETILVEIKDSSRRITAEYVDMNPGSEMVSLEACLMEKGNEVGSFCLDFVLNGETYDLTLFLAGRAISDDSCLFAKHFVGAKFAQDGKMREIL